MSIHITTTPQDQALRESLEKLAAINYNLYLGSPAHRADTDEEWTYEQAINELVVLIQTAVQSERDRILGLLPREIDGKSLLDIGSEYATPKDYRRQGYNAAIREMRAIISKEVQK